MTHKNLIFIAIILATVTASVGLAASGIFWGIPFVVVTAVIWLSGEFKSWRWLTGLGLFLFVVIISISLLIGLFPWAAVVTAVLALIAWDMSHFYTFLSQVARVDHQTLIVARYRQRLLVITGSGLLIALIATTIRIQVTFSLALFLGLIAIIGFSRAISFLRKESD